MPSSPDAAEGAENAAALAQGERRPAQRSRESMPNRLRPAAMSLADLLGHYRSFRVPEYQRVYAWGEHQVGLLLSAL